MNHKKTNGAYKSDGPIWVAIGLTGLSDVRGRMSGAWGSLKRIACRQAPTNQDRVQRSFLAIHGIATLVHPAHRPTSDPRRPTFQMAYLGYILANLTREMPHERAYFAC